MVDKNDSTQYVYDFTQNRDFRIINDAKEYPETERSNNGGYKSLDTYKNLKWLLDKFSIIIRHNRMTRKREIIIPGIYIFADDFENDSIARIDYLSTINKMPTKKVDQNLDILAGENPYHPIVECIKSNPWDGIPRLEEFIRTLETKDPDFSHIIIRTWMVCAIAAAHSVDGFINNGVLVLQGKQNIGKTRWVKSLDPINCGAIKEGAFLDPTNKDSISELASYWIAELGELDSIFQKSAIGRLKSFITMQSDYIRLPYARKATRIARRTAYVATVNDENYLIDETGNRRWWTIEINSINLDHNLDMQQVWAEVFDLWQKGYPVYLTSDLQQTVNESNKRHERVDPLKEKLLGWYDWSITGRKWLSATDVLEEIGYTKPSRADATRMGVILKEINGEAGKRVQGITRHQVPALIKIRGSM